jgi:hypothetical protein
MQQQQQGRHDTRRSKRHYVLTGARIVLADGVNMEACRMVDVSSGGARLELAKASTVPDQFVLLLSHDGSLQRQCSVVWRSDTALGVEFIPHMPASQT